MDNLTAVANPIADSDLVSTLLSVLPPEYDSFVTFINTRVDPVLSEELIDLILSQEIYREYAITTPDSIALISSPPAVHTAPSPQATTRLHLFFVIEDVAEAGSAVIVMDVHSHYHISLSVADLNTRSTIIFSIMLISATIVMMILLFQLA